MAITIGASVEAQDDTTTATSLSFSDPPASIATDDYMIAVIASRGGGTWTVWTPPSGWTQIFSHPAGGRQLAAWYKKVTNGATEAGPYAFDMAEGGCKYGAIIRVSGANGTTLLDVTGTSEAGAASSSPAHAAGVSTTDTATMLFGVLSLERNQSVSASPSGMTERVDGNTDNATASNNVTLYIGTEPLSVSGATGSRTWTSAQARPYSVNLFALKEAGGNATATPASLACVSAFPATGNGQAVTVYTDSDVATSANIVPSTGSGHFGVINESPASGQPDADYLYNAAGDGSDYLDLQNVPSDFSSIRSVRVRAYVNPESFTTDTCTAYATIYDTTTAIPYTSEVAFATQATAEGMVEVELPLVAAGTAANEDDWNAATIRIRYDYTA